MQLPIDESDGISNWHETGEIRDVRRMNNEWVVRVETFCDSMK